MRPSNLDDQDRINHILAECEFLLALKPTITMNSLVTDGIIFRAVCYSFVIIGESCHHLSAGYKARISEIDWKLPYQMRNILVHNYDSIRLNTIWGTLVEDIPKLNGYLLANSLDRKQI